MKTIKFKKPPAFKSIQEEVKFWDTHDVIDYAVSLKEQLNPFKVKHDQSITIRFRPNDLQKIKTVANTKGIGVTTFIRMMALDNLKHYQSA